MNCSACGHENPERAKFCLECGTPVAARCADCGAELPPAAKFCLECGARVAAASGSPSTPRAGEARKVVSIVFADLLGSTALQERLDAESVRRLMERYYAALRTVVEAHGGTVVKLLGDGVMAAFGVRQVAEDDAIRAVRAAAAMHDAFRAVVGEQGAVASEIGLRVAVNTGEVVVSGAQDDVVGDPVNVAARLQEEARDGDVVIGEATRRLVATLVTLESLGSLALKGRAETVQAYRVASLEPPAGATAAPFVGRVEEIARLNAVYDEAVAVPAARLAVLVGSPGLGKSRLIDEFVRRHGDAVTPLTAHCDAAGGATFAPFSDALRELLDLDTDASPDALHDAVAAVLADDEPDGARITAGIVALLAGSPGAPEETFFVIRRLLAGLAATKPVVLVIDDLQWAEPLLLDLVEHLVQWGEGLRLLILIGARPELRDVRSSLATQGGVVADAVMLEGLDAGAAMRLAAGVIGAADLPAAVAAKVLATSEGNPLFVGELVRMLVQEGALTKEGDRWTIGTNLAALEMPPTIHALLAARIERLRPEECEVIERAAVVGRHFSRGAVAALLPGAAGDLDTHLEALRRSELIESDAGWLLGEPVLRFHHVLIRDAAYRRLLKERRAELHGRLADWIEAKVGDASEHDETIGRHLEQAHQLLGELGPLDEEGKQLGERAASRLAAAGRNALARDDVPLAAGLLGRALDRLEADDPSRAELALDWCEALLAAGDVGTAATAIDELGRVAVDSDRLRAWHTCFTGQHTVLTAPEALRDTADAVAAAAAELAALGDAAGEAKAHFVHALALASLGQVGDCEAALDRALAAARRANDRRRANTVLALAPLAALWGPSPVTRASGRCLDVVRVLRITQGAPAVEAVALSCQGVLEALRGRTDAAKRMIASARTMVEELGITQRLFETDVFAGQVALLEGEPAEAEGRLRGAYEGLRDLGLGIDAARASALLGRALLAQDRADEADALSHESEELAGDDLKAAIAWRGVRAEALARRGEHATAVELASKAVEIAAGTDALLDHADARLALAAALRAAGRGSEADAEERRAAELWEAKGATLLAERAQAEGPRVEPSASTPARLPETRRVRANTATKNIERCDAAIAVHDIEAVQATMSERQTIIHHPTGSTYGTPGLLETWRSLFPARDLVCRHTPLATLGDSLALVGQSTSHAGRDLGDGGSVGPVELDCFLLLEVDEEGQVVWTEVFAEDHLGSAIARFYERYAEQLAAGLARDRATATAHAVTAMLTRSEEHRVEDFTSPDFEAVDHRMVGLGSDRGLDLVARWRDASNELMEEQSFRIDDVLALSADALLRRTTVSGKVRASGGAFEITNWGLSVFGPDGRSARLEIFDVGHEAEALARFDELTGATAPRPVSRRVRPNAATAKQAWFEARVAARDFGALLAGFSEDHQEVDHSTGATYGAEESVASVERLFRSRDPHYSIEPIATLGSSLFLGRRRSGASGAAGARYDVGEYQDEKVQIVELGERGLTSRCEVFGIEHLGDAITRLYERYAELLSDGPAKDRAAATARTVTAMLTRSSEHRLEDVMVPDLQAVDHRTVGIGSASGPDLLPRWRAASDELMEDPTFVVEDVLALSADGVLRRTTQSGKVRASGGEFENRSLALSLFGPDGRLTRLEVFDLGHEAEALARFDELVGRAPEESASEPPWSNAATRLNERFVRAWAARDWDAVMACYSSNWLYEDRRPLMGVQTETLAGVEEGWRTLFDVPNGRWRVTPIATRGERLVLSRIVFEGDAPEGGGALAIGYLAIDQVGDDGAFDATVLLDPDDLDAAYDELDRRYEAGDGAGAARTFHAFSRAIGNRDWDRMIAVCDPRVVEHDHRSLATLGPTLGPAAWATSLRTHIELAPDTVYRVEHMRTAGRYVLWRIQWEGTREGGRYELPLCGVTKLNEREQIAQVEIYEPEQLDQVCARFAALSGNGPELPSRAGFANAATRAVERGTAALAARDWDAFSSLFAADFRNIDRRALVHLESGREEWLEAYRRIVEMTSGRPTHEVLATRGERLALVHMLWQGEEGDVGPSEIERLLLVEVDEQGDHRVVVMFDPDEIDAARAELDVRFAAGEGATHPAAMTWLADYLRAFAAHDFDTLTALLSPDLVAQNHRLVGWGTRHGPEGVVSTMRAQFELAPDTQARVDHVRLCDRGMILEYAWHGTREGGPFENVWVDVFELDAEGRVCRADVFEAEQIGEARTRFEEITAGPASEGTPSAHFANAATRHLERALAALPNRDFDAFAAQFAHDFRNFDRRPHVQLESDREQWLSAFRQIAEMTSRRPVHEVLATRGERLALVKIEWEGSGDDVGPSEIDWVLVIEVDDHGNRRVGVTFEPTQLDAAYEELDTRWEAGEARRHPSASAWVAAWRRTFASRAWEAMAALGAPDQVAHNHRLVGWGTRRGAGFEVKPLRELVALAPDVRQRFDHMRTCERGTLMGFSWVGTREGGAFETPVLVVVELDDEGHQRRLDVWDGDMLDAAVARFGEVEAGTVSAVPSAERFANAATRLLERAVALFAGRDWDGFAALLPPGFQAIDRRAVAQLEADREGWLTGWQHILEMTSARPRLEVLATRGDRLALARMLWQGESADIGPSEMEGLIIAEMDDQGRNRSVVMFDPDDLDVAYAEIEARFAASERATHAPVAAWTPDFRAAFERRDWVAAARCLAPTFVGRDHRLVGWGTLHGPAAFLESLRAMVELAPDVRHRSLHVRHASRGFISDSVWIGTRDGGAFESPYILVLELDTHGQAQSMDFYDPHHVDDAVARFEAVQTTAFSPDPGTAIAKPNAAMVTLERMWAAFEAQDVDAARALCAADLQWEDRQSVVGLSGDAELMLASARERLASGARAERLSMLGTAGDRVVVARVLWAGGPADGRFEMEFLAVQEVDESGQCTASIFFDADDERAAQREAWARWTRIDPVAKRWVDMVSSLSDSYNARDITAFGAFLSEDCDVDDHRWTGFGRVDRAAYIEAVTALWELAPDARIATGWHWLACERHAALTVLRRSGTIADGGAFEIDDLALFVMVDGVVTHIEFFELNALDVALARFEELRPDPLRIPPNAAAQTIDRWCEAFRSGDEETMRALTDPSLIMDDRRRILQMTGDRDMDMFNTRWLFEGGWRPTRTLLATAGDHLVLQRWLWTSGEADASPEIEVLEVDELNDEGRFVRSVAFDPDDRAAASTELFERWVALGADGTPRAEIEVIRGASAHDLAHVRAGMSDDFVMDDHRRTGLGRIDGADAYLASIAALYELSPDWRVDYLYTVAEAKHGRVRVQRTSGTNTEGGPFERVFVIIVMCRGEKVVGFETYELEDLDTALARLEELRPDPLRIPPNDATRNRDRACEYGAAGDWEALRALYASEVHYEDRRPMLRNVGDKETVIGELEFLWGEAGGKVERTLLATAGDRLALEHWLWTARDDSAPFELDALVVVDVDADGLVDAIILFHPDDRAAASLELVDRWIASGVDGMPESLGHFLRAWNGHDVERMGALLPDDYYFHDRRRTGVGRVDREGYLASLKALHELSPDARLETLYAVAASKDGMLTFGRSFGVNAEGGEFETVYFSIVWYRHGRVAGVEVFEVEDLDAARARFDELCGAEAS